MSTINSEKDSPLGQTVLPPEPFPFFENPRFPPTLYMRHVRHLSVKGPSLLANQWVQRSEEGHWVEEEYFQESKNLLEKVEEDLYQGTFNIWQLWIERRHLTVSYIGEAITVPVSVVQCQYGG